MEHYNHIRLLLQRDVLAPCSGEAKAHYNTVQVFFKIVLVVGWLTKSLYNELWGTIYNKGWGDPWHSPLWQFNYPHDCSTTLMTVHLPYDYYIQLLRLDLHLTWLNITMHMYSCETIWLDQDITDTWSAAWDQLFDMLVMVKVVSRCQAWSSVMMCMHLMVTSRWSKLLPPLQPVHWFNPFHPTCLLTCTWSSWI